MFELSSTARSAILSEGRLFEVGGAVRDRFLNKEGTPKDRDYLVTGIEYERLSKLLRQFGRVDLVGRSFGVIKFTQYGKNENESCTFDIALPRKEFSTGSGHRDFKVDFDPELPIEDDLGRRDFTVNAMAIELGSDKLIDPFNGMADLEKRQLRIVYDRSFEDDPLRMLRAVQFAARFDFEIEPETLRQISENVGLIKTVSPERIAEELNKLLTLSDKPSVGFRLLQTTSLLKNFFPELETCVKVHQPGGYHKYDVFEHTMHIIDAVKPTLRLRLAALFHDINKPQSKRTVEGGATFYGHETFGSKTAKSVMHRLRYSHDLADEVALLVDRHMFTTDVTDKGLRRIIRKVGVELIYDLLDLRRADVIAQGMGGTTEDVDEFEQRIRDEIAKQPPFGYSDLAIDGADLMKLLSLKPGPVVGELLEQIMEKVLDNPEDNKRENLESFAKEYYQTVLDRGNKV